MRRSYKTKGFLSVLIFVSCLLFLSPPLGSASSAEVIMHARSLLLSGPPPHLEGLYSMVAYYDKIKRRAASTVEALETRVGSYKFHFNSLTHEKKNPTGPSKMWEDVINVPPSTRVLISLTCLRRCP